MATSTPRSRAASRRARQASSGPADRRLVHLPIESLRANPRNPRQHNRAQIEALAKSIDAFGFNAPVLVDRDNTIIAGHARVAAAKLRGLGHVPVIRLEHLTEAQAQAYMLADNKFTDRSQWDPKLLAIHLKELSELVIDFDIEATGFEIAEIDLLVQEPDEADRSADAADEVPAPQGPPISQIGDLWQLGEHRIYCGDARQADCYATVLAGEPAAMVFADAPYNVPITGHVSGLGKTRHREFAMAAGEMSAAEFTQFLTEILKHCARHSRDGAIHFQCMDWRHTSEMLAAGRAAYSEWLNLCVWAKPNGGMGSLYRSRHELVFVFKSGKAAHRNNIQLGRFGRNRTNIWTYPGANGFGARGDEKKMQRLHPTVKPVALVADAILDATARREIVLDPFLGSGTTIIAAERTGRRGCGIELDALYVDAAIRRWQRLTGNEARHRSGRSFADLELERTSRNEAA